MQTKVQKMLVDLLQARAEAKEAKAYHGRASAEAKLAALSAREEMSRQAAVASTALERSELLEQDLALASQQVN